MGPRHTHDGRTDSGRADSGRADSGRPDDGRRAPRRHPVAFVVLLVLFAVLGGMGGLAGWERAGAEDLFSESAGLDASDLSAVQQQVCGALPVTSARSGRTGCQSCPLGLAGSGRAPTTVAGVAPTTTVRPGATARASSDPSLVFGPVFGGALSAPGAREALVAVSGCGADGTVVLARNGSAWRLVRADPGPVPDACLRFPQKSGATLLVCHETYTGAGRVGERLVTLAVGARSTVRTRLFTVESNRGDCAAPTIDVVEVVRWTKADTNGDGRPDLAVQALERRLARPAGPCPPVTPLPDPVVHRLYFRFDGAGFTAAPVSAATVACLDTPPSTTAAPRRGRPCPVEPGQPG